MSGAARIVLIAALLVASLGVFDAEAASQDTVMDRVSDWFAVFGKSEDEKNLILAQRRSRRIAARMQKEAEESMKQFNKKMKEAFGR